MINNSVKNKLMAGEVSIGTMVFEFNTPGIASIIDQTSADFIIYDMEHSSFGNETIRQLMSYNRGLSVLPFVRVPETQYSYIARVLDAGAMGLMIPMVETKDQVNRIINASKYSPIGNRGAGFGIAHDNFTSGDPLKKMKEANDETLVIALIETETGVNNIEQIVSTHGIDVAMIGHLDLSISMGIPGQINHPRMIAAMEKVVEACDKYGKVAGRNVLDVSSAITWIEKGYRFIAYSGDIWLLQRSLSIGISEIRNTLNVI